MKWYQTIHTALHTKHFLTRFPLMFEESWRLRLLQAKRTARSYRVKTSIFHNSQPADTGWRWRDVLPASCAFAVPCRFPWAVGLTPVSKEHKHGSVAKKKTELAAFRYRHPTNMPCAAVPGWSPCRKVGSQVDSDWMDTLCQIRVLPVAYSCKGLLQPSPVTKSFVAALQQCCLQRSQREISHLNTFQIRYIF